MSACKDCATEGITTNRPAGWPGPRCTTHWRIERKRRQGASHARNTTARYGLSSDDYSALYDAQGGHCAICEKATGATRRLAVDHEHDRAGCTHPPERGCQLCIRGLLCGPCNQVLIGRYDAAALTRAIDYLTDPPARKVLAPARPQAFARVFDADWNALDRGPLDEVSRRLTANEGNH